MEKNLNQEKNSYKPYLKRPLILSVINWIYLIIPVYYGTIYAYLVVKNAPDFVYNTIFFLGVMTLGSLLTGLALLKTSLLSWYAVLIHSTLVIAHNIYSFIKISDFSSITSILGIIFSVLMALLIIYFIALRKNFRALFFLPRLKWWESKKRFQINITGVLVTEKSRYDVLIQNISTGGIKIQSETDISQEVKDYSSTIDFNSNGESLSVNLVLVWADHNLYGMKFVDLTPQTKKSIKKLVSQLKKEDKQETGR